MISSITIYLIILIQFEMSFEDEVGRGNQTGVV